MFKAWDMASDIQMARHALAMIYSIKRGNKPKASALPYKTHDVRVPVRDGTTIPARIYTPKKRSPPRGWPCMYICHAGDYVVGEFDTEEWLCEAFVAMGGVAVDVLYRHAPEHVFPVQVHDSYDGLRWVSTRLCSRRRRARD